MANEFVIKNGFISQGTSSVSSPLNITGNLNISGNLTNRNLFSSTQGVNIFEFSQGATNAFPQFFIKKTDGKGFAAGADTYSGFLAYDNAGTFYIASVPRSEIDAGHCSTVDTNFRISSGVTKIKQLEVASTIAATTTAKIASNGNISAPNLIGVGADINTSGTLSVYSGMGTASAEISVKAGTSVAAGTVDANAKLFSVRTGIGGSESEYFYVNKSVVATPNELRGGFVTANNYITAPSFVANGAPLPIRLTGWTYNQGLSTNVAAQIGAIQSMKVAPPLSASNNRSRILELYAGVNGTTADLAAYVEWNGMIAQSGSNTTGSAGNATINTPIGTSAIASGSSNVTITNYLVNTGSVVLLTWHGDHGAARWWVTRNTGSFTVNLSNNATENTAFSWHVSAIL